MRLFISYTKQDTEKISQLVTLLIQGGHDCSLDKQPQTSRESEVDLQKTLAQFDAFVYMITSESVVSETCHLEFVTAVEIRLPVVLIMLEKVDLPLFLNRYSYIDMTDEISSEAIAALLGNLYSISHETSLGDLLNSPIEPKQKVSTQPRPRRRIALGILVVSLVFVSLAVFLLGMISLTTASTSSIYTPPTVNPGFQDFDRQTLVPTDLRPSVNVCQVDCEFTLISTALEFVEPGGTINVGTGTYEEKVTLTKSVTLVGAGSELTSIRGRSQGYNEAVVVIKSDQNIRVNLEGIAIDAVAIQGRTEVSLTDIVIDTPFFTGLSVSGSSQVTVANSQFTSSNYGIQIFENGRATVSDSIITDNDGNRNPNPGGIWVYDNGQLHLIRSQVTNNSTGIAASGRSVVLVEDTTISGSIAGPTLAGGILLREVARVELRNSTIDSTGTNDTCLLYDQQGPRDCNGIILSGQAQLLVKDSTISGSTDWGISAQARHCGYPNDQFIGQVTFEGTNVIEGNNRSRNHDTRGNPGNHPWNQSDVSPGQVCLPTSS